MSVMNSILDSVGDFFHYRSYQIASTVFAGVAITGLVLFINSENKKAELELDSKVLPRYTYFKEGKPLWTRTFETADQAFTFEKSDYNRMYEKDAGVKGKIEYLTYNQTWKLNHPGEKQ